jgi:hypothetical protein
MDHDKISKVNVAIQDHLFSMIGEEMKKEHLTDDEKYYVNVLIACKLIWFVAGSVKPHERDSFMKSIEEAIRDTVREGMIAGEKNDEEELKEMEKDPDPAIREDAANYRRALAKYPIP